MPQITLEHSPHFDGTDWRSLALQIHRHCVELVGAGLGSCKTRIVRSENVIIADGDPAHQKLARDSFQRAGIPASRHRFLPSRPLDVLSRLAPGAYDLIYADVSPAEIETFRERAWPLLSDGGVLVFAGVLLDGTIADESRRDRDTVAAREAEQHLLEREDALATRMPIGAGAIALIKK